jgi:hypothetical protein
MAFDLAVDGALALVDEALQGALGVFSCEFLGKSVEEVTGHSPGAVPAFM